MNFRKLIRGKYALGSARLSLYSVIGLIFVYLLGLLIPQKGLLGEEVYYAWRVSSPELVRILDSLGVTHIYSSWLAYSFLVLFFLNLTVNLISRTGAAARKSAMRPRDFDENFIRHLQASGIIRAPEADPSISILNNLSEGLKELGFKVAVYGDRVFAVKNRFAPIGSILFHVSFFLLLIGGLLLLYTRFSGGVILGEHERFSGKKDEYVYISREPLIKDMALPELAFEVLSVAPVYKNGLPSDLRVTILAKEAGFDVERKISINHPYKKGPISVLVKDIGVAPLLKLKNMAGREVEAGYYKLNVLRGQEEMLKFQSIELPVLIRFFPDHIIRDGVPGSASLELKNPMLYMRVRGDKGKDIFNEKIRPGEQVMFGGYFFEFGEEIKYWVELTIIKEYGGGVLWAGFIICILGLIVRLAVRRIELYALLKDGDIYFGGSAEHLSRSFKLDFETIVAHIKKYLRI